MIRKAHVRDVRAIHKVLSVFAARERLLPRSLSDLYTNIRDMFVFADDRTGAIHGCCGCHIIWEDLAEVRSLAVLKRHQGKGIGRALVSACIEEARELGIGRLFALTYETEFFGRMGFSVVDKNIFPQKIWADCLHCPKFPGCDETAMVLNLAGGEASEPAPGPLPRAARIAPC